MFRLGNKSIGLLAILLDVSNAAVPVGLSYYNIGKGGILWYFITIAPVRGHILSPFLGFHGGKAIAVSWGKRWDIQ